MSQKLVQQLKEKIEEKKSAKRGKGFRGFKATLVAEAENLMIQTEVRYSKIDSRDVDIALKVVAKSKSTGKIVRYGFIGEYHKGYVTEDGEEVPASDVEWYQILGDKEIPVRKFERTKRIEIIKYIPRSKLDNYLIESQYEMWSENVPALWKFAEWLNKRDKVAVARFSFGNSFKEYYALIYPHIENGRFVLVMALTRKNLEFKHLMPITNGTVKIEPPKGTVRSVLKIDI